MEILISYYMLYPLQDNLRDSVIHGFLCDLTLINTMPLIKQEND